MSRLVVFILIYFAVYGAMHLYLLVKIRRAYYLQALGQSFLALLFLFLILAPIQSRLLETQGLEIASMISAWMGFSWMGFVFLFLCLSLPMDAYHLLLSVAQHITDSDLTHLMLSRRQCVTITGILAICLMVYGALEADRLRIESVTLETSKISTSKNRIRIVQISDLHLGNMCIPGRLKAVVDAVKAAQPDMLVSTGDLTDGRIPYRLDAAELLGAISAPMGKFAVTGNHEFYAHTDYATQFIQSAGFTILRNRSFLANKDITVIGVDDPAGGPAQAITAEKALLAQTPKRRFALLLKHRPTILPESQGRFDLQLSGHTHKGQIFPFGLLIKLLYSRYHGLHRLTSGASLYISRGTGTWGPPIRVLSPPEITIIDLVPAQK